MASVILDLTDELIAKVRRVNRDIRPGTRVVFLDNGVSSPTYAAHERGRLGYFHRNDADGFYLCDAGATYASHRDIASINMPVNVGDEIVVLRADGYNYATGARSRVTHVSDSGARINAQALEATRRAHSGNIIYAISHWAFLATTSVTPNGGAAAVATTEIPEIPEYWENRVRTIAREYSRRYGMCSRVDQALTEIFSVNQRYRVGNQNGTVIVRDPQGNEIASFGGPNPQEHAEILVRQLNAQQHPAA